ncbi:MAG: glycosyltransferase, partial [Acidobacteriota bacterium]|nr:glycosyltransferase [Acidobacteriota bacterium]
YGTPASKIGVLRWGVDARTFTPTAPCNALGAEDPYLLFVGALLPRRRPIVMLDAFAEVAKERPELSFVIAGTDRLPDGGTLESAIRERDLADRVVRLGWVDETDLPGLIGGAAATIYLSTYEGFGIPPLESLACGTLAVVSAGLALDDLWPDYPYRARNLSGADVARSLRAVLATSPQTEAVREQGLALARSLTWRKCAEAFLEEIESLR